MRKITPLAFLLSAFLVSHGQQEAKDSILPKKTSFRYVGIQANLLLQQFISFNSNSSINSNPYVFSFSKNNIKSGKGFVFGSGFNISETSSNDGISSNTVDNINLAFRIGTEKKYLQGEKFIPFWGIDVAFGALYNNVTSQLNQSFGSTSTNVQTTKFFLGPAFRGGVLFSLSKHILLGTECFFNAQLAYNQVSSSSGGFSSGFVPLNIGFQVPTALFLIFKY